jgi:hypothetical protein
MSSSQHSHTTIILLKISNLSLNILAMVRHTKETKAVGTKIDITINISRNMAISTIKAKAINIKATTSNNLTPVEGKCTSKSKTTTRIIITAITIARATKAKTRVKVAIKAMLRTRVTVDPILITNRTSIGL